MKGVIAFVSRGLSAAARIPPINDFTHPVWRQVPVDRRTETVVDGESCPPRDAARRKSDGWYRPIALFTLRETARRPIGSEREDSRQGMSLFFRHLRHGPVVSRVFVAFFLHALRFTDDRTNVFCPEKY